jgi:uncharacterized protein
VTATSLHEVPDSLSVQTIDEHRAYRSLMEELEAIDWYAQRIDASADAELKKVLAHNRDEEKEHAAMVLEWLRRRDPVFDGFLRTYLFREGPLEEVEHAEEGVETPDLEVAAADYGVGAHIGLGIGSLRLPPG